MARRRYGRAHQRARAALLPLIEWGATLCSRCLHPLLLGDEVDLDHDDSGQGYRGFSHHSPCRICGARCNQKAGGELGALRQGKQLRGRRCVVCGMPYEAGSGSAGAAQATCGRRSCITELRRRRKAREPDGEPPPPTGRVW
jgi:hypothetical protein